MKNNRSSHIFLILLACLGSHLTSTAHASPPLSARVDDKPIAKGTDYLYILRTIQDNMGLYGPTRSKFFLLKLDNTSGAIKEHLLIQSAITEEVNNRNSDRSNIEANQDFHLFSHLQEERGFPILGSELVDTHYADKHLNISNELSGYVIERHYNLPTSITSNNAVRREVATLSHEMILLLVNKSINQSLKEYVGKAPEMHNNEFYYLLESTITNEENCDLSDIIRMPKIFNTHEE